MNEIGYVGLGAMGGALAQRLLETQSLVVYDLNPDAVDAKVKLGAEAAPTAQALAARCSIILLCLPTSEHVQEAVLGAGGLADAAEAGTVFVDQTSGAPNISRAIAAHLAERNMWFVDAPVSGGVAGALAGTIAVMVGASDDDFARVSPVLEAISNNIFRAGPVGSGHAMKLVNNMMSGAQRVLTFESLALGVSNGVELQGAVEILLAGGARNAYLERVIKPWLVDGGEPPPFTLRLAHKDVRLACELGSASGSTTFYGNLTKDLLQAAINEYGADAQVDEVGRLIDKLSGSVVVSGAHQNDAGGVS